MSGDATPYSMEQGLDVFEHQKRIIVFKFENGVLVWARPTGEAELELDDELRAAIAAHCAKVRK